MMELKQAKEIVTALANGVNPTTGEVLPPASPYNNPAIIRALFTVLKYVRGPKLTLEQRQQQNIAAGRAKNYGLPWSEIDRASIAEKFKGGASVEQMSAHFERSKGAIVAELEQQGLITPEQKDSFLHRN
ncbi:MAG: hypothetical protein R3F48_01885 [Candidatus Zixiibacteriota bacterium]